MSHEPQFVFRNYWVDGVTFETGEKRDESASGTAEADGVAYKIVFHLGAGINDELLRAQITMTVSLEGDPRSQPYKIEVKVTGQFEATEGTATKEQFRAFCHTNVPVILFPYVREIIHRTTAEGRYGRVRLNPINITAQMPEWKPVEATDASSAPQPPSEQ